MLNRIKSFEINHDKLEKGLYVSRVDGDVITYDLRMKVPNSDDYLSTGQAHTIEHIMATYLRNTAFKQEVIYVGPMGCRTGFYILLRDSISKEDAIQLIRDAMQFLSDFTGEIPGATRIECGNYKDQDLDGAKEVARDMTYVLKNWSKDQLEYIK